MIDFFDHKEVEYADLDVSVSGARLGKLRGLTVAIEIDLEHLFGAGNKAISIQAGNERVTGSLKVLKGAVDDIWEASIKAGAPNPLYVEFDIMGTFKGSGSRPMKQLLISTIRLSKVEYSLMQGDKFMEIELPFLALDMQVA